MPTASQINDEVTRTSGLLLSPDYSSVIIILYPTFKLCVCVRARARACVAACVRGCVRVCALNNQNQEEQEACIQNAPFSGHKSLRLGDAQLSCVYEHTHLYAGDCVAWFASTPLLQAPSNNQ